MSNGVTNNELLTYLGLPESIISEIATGTSDTYQAAKNTFLTNLYNKIIYSAVESMDFENPFKKFDGYPVNYGDTVEALFVETISGKKFDPNNTNPFPKQKPSVLALYSTINYDMQYKVTIEDAQLRKACLSEYGFMQLIDYILATLSKSMTLDEYFATIKLLNNVNIYANGFEQITKKATDEETAKAVAKMIVEVSSNMTLPNKTNNKQKTMTVSKASDVVLIIKNTLLNSINMDYLTGVYNLSKVDLVNNIIKVESFLVDEVYEDTTTHETKTRKVGTDIDFIILDRKCFENHVALQDGGLIYNPEGKYTNHYMNLWKILGFKTFRNARAFQLKDSQ